MLEGMSYLAHRLIYDEYSVSTMRLWREEVIAGISQQEVHAEKALTQNRARVREVVHPYTGFVVLGETAVPGCYTGGYECLQKVQGFADLPMPKRSDSELHVAILGGSVAVGTVNGTAPNLYARLLGRLPQFQGKKINIHNLALGGYHQPQQLMSLAYYYSIGAEFDLVINLDGFNEVAVTASE